MKWLHQRELSKAGSKKLLLSRSRLRCGIASLNHLAWVPLIATNLKRGLPTKDRLNLIKVSIRLSLRENMSCQSIRTRLIISRHTTITIKPIHRSSNKTQYTCPKFSMCINMEHKESNSNNLKPHLSLSLKRLKKTLQLDRWQRCFTSKQSLNGLE